MEKEKKLKKDRECIHCINFFDCKGKPDGVEQCLRMVKKSDG